MATPAPTHPSVAEPTESGATPAASAPPAKASHAAKPGGMQVARPGGICAVSGRVITPGEKFMATVRETTEGLERVDVGVEHWESFDKAGLLGYWQAVMPRPEQKKKVFVDDEVLATVFERLADATEPAKIAFRFVLGLILMRKRLVMYDSARQDPAPAGSPEGTPGRDVWVVRLKGRTDLLDLFDPKLDEKRVAEVSQQLGEILNEEI